MMRRVPLARRTELGRGDKPLRRTEIRRMSTKRRRQNRHRAEVVDGLVAERGPWCELRVEGVCRGMADAGHEILKRSRGGSITDPDNILLACNPCNGWVEDHPREANAAGWAAHSWDAPLRGQLPFYALAVVFALAVSVVPTPGGSPSPGVGRPDPAVAASPQALDGPLPGSGHSLPPPSPDVAPGAPADVAPVAAVPEPTSEPCTASWYGEELRGATTASGAPFDPDRLTVASWDHPFGTLLEVTAATTGAQVVVEVTDRGPARRLDRCLDLSLAAFTVIGEPDAGLVQVTYEEVGS